jgi:hypothetical protein
MSSASGNNNNNNNNNNLAAREFASAVLSGTVIGRSLQDALHSLSQEDEKDQSSQPGDDDDEENGDGDDDDDDQQATTSSKKKKADDKKYIVRMDVHSMDKIIKSFGDAVAESSRKEIGNSSPAECEAEADADDQQQDLLAVAAPRALLKGRCKHYNKFGQNWMVSIDQVRIKQRPIKFTKRRRNDRPSLWDRDNDDGVITTTSTTTTTTTTTNTNKEIPVKEKIQLLAYGDLP